MKRNNLINFVILAAIFVFLFSYFKPSLLFSSTITTGGDTPSHYPTAVYLKEVFLPQGKIMGWDPGNYAGFPVFYHYFPLTYLLMVVLSYLIPMQVAFKIVSVLGTFFLPVCVYFMFRLLKYRFPVPIIGAVFSLGFLFLEANSMWGGNIPSTLAGESSYSLSLSLMVLFFGLLYRGIEDKNMIIPNALLVFLMGFSHGFTLVFSGVIAGFFLFTRKDFWQNIIYLFKVFGLAGLLLSFWFIPFLSNLPYVTSYAAKWHISSWLMVIPITIIPFFALSLGAFILNLFDKRTIYFAYVILAATVLYYAAPQIGMLDIRFVPFIQLYLVIFGATLILVFLRDIKMIQLIPFIVFLTTVLWLAPNITFIKDWIKWNYEGFESKKTWPLFQDINNYLAKTPKGRVVYEHSPAHNAFGSERAFENLPYFAKRETLEGLYMQSSISSPFVFYIQSAVSRVHSGPFPQYEYTNLNLPAAIPLLEMFNVTQYIARSPEAKKQAKTISALKLEKTFEDYEIYRLATNSGNYVVPLQNEPILFSTDNWKRDFYQWFRVAEFLSVPLVYIKEPSAKDLERFALKSDSLVKLKRQPLKMLKPRIYEQIGAEEIRFTTNLIGYPHLLKVSYHPNWRVEGADKIYLVSPSFMLVYPDANKVRLYFGKTKFNYLGETLSLAGLFILLISGIIHYRYVRQT
ncbi:hypothetical protein A3H38_00220 [candidate division WOR-1 bacterium RIFCSPLOWO2_02_FULL_46_20]|uniref:Membrane protein 6-pyruvoyl-tetrahydropterin synthase-related domain-containing protein n=2 Tax=Saganbacteria TaxID=1703751 RepID=A0A1F4R6W4_UNCSA|nr:MAG: hypothetical protein A3J44_06640 [candidate division WOR-1 bacterium RIFCSPHIGHO2_02_FULL_45_12]OGC03183.1 MAG: hypothetical protein A3H38_00220 [candidate division WOR-1 bacterium RIFCSPLOWO2_02_FULL_46_20]OGC09825.1 MAG: hypothetical protein A3F86_03985 [candidate division WOR-1 bacterium RIFCSPLOWO2_12_FULL_45_9]